MASCGLPTSVVLGLLGYGARVAFADSMDCGTGVPLCGVLTLESGYGSGYYEHDEPSVHGLWPETGAYGTSQCIAPTDPTDPTKIYSCYVPEDGDTAHQLEFEDHEWDKHGKCAGVRDVADYFAQICSLSSAPLKVMSDTRKSRPGDFAAMKTALSSAGFPVWGETGNSEVLLSACAREDGRWKLAPVSSFGAVCRGTTPTPSPSPSPTSRCVPNTHGPACSSNDDCVGVPDCVRCANSGYCTDVPLLDMAV